MPFLESNQFSIFHNLAVIAGAPQPSYAFNMAQVRGHGKGVRILATDQYMSLRVTLNHPDCGGFDEGVVSYFEPAMVSDFLTWTDKWGPPAAPIGLHWGSRLSIHRGRFAWQGDARDYSFPAILDDLFDNRESQDPEMGAKTNLGPKVLKKLMRLAGVSEDAPFTLEFPDTRGRRTPRAIYATLPSPPSVLQELLFMPVRVHG